MQVLHGLYSPHKNKISLWTETKDQLSVPNINIISGNKGTMNLLLPTSDSLFISSPLIIRAYNLDFPKNFDWQYHDIKCLYVNAITIQSLKATDNLLFAEDLVYWIQMIKIVSEILDHDLYIPSIKEDNTPGWATYHPDIQVLASKMPDICCYINGEYYNKEQLLQYFFDSTVTEIANSIHISAAQAQIINGTILEKFFNTQNKKHQLITSEEKNNWMIWKSALDKYRHDICLKIESPSSKCTNWTLEILVQDKDDPSKKVAINNNWHAYLHDLGLAMRIYPQLELAFDKDNIIPFELSQEDALIFLKETAWILQQSGFPVIIPSWYTPKGHNAAKLKLKQKSSISSSQSETSYFSVESIISFEHSLSLNGQEISAEEWKQLIDNKEELVEFRGQWVQLDLNNMSEILDFWQNNQDTEMNIFDLLNRSSRSDVELDEKTDQFIMSLYGKQNFDHKEEPNGFIGKLRPYQKLGYSWMLYMEKIGLNPCLADDMGLGKTIQVIALILFTKSKKNLLVVPTSVIGNWEREFAKFAPELLITTYHTKNKDLEFEKSNVVITTFTILRKEHKVFSQIKWHRIIVDEAQNIKNPNAKQSKSLFNLSAKHKIALTGTPIENSVVDLWSIFNFLNKDYLGHVKQFKKLFHNQPVNRPQLKRLVEPFILRRLKTDKSIISELPDKIEQNIYCQLTKEQASLYQAVVNQLEENTTNGKIDGAAMLSSLTRLKQICNHPMQYLQDNSDFSSKRSLKLQRLELIVDEAIENEESILIFSQYKEICDAINKFFITKYNTYLLHGSTSRSSRDNMINEFQDNNTPPSIFILSLKAGGVGITLTKASQVIHFDRWWNPAVENQATDRAFRIGQQKKVLVHKFITQGTLEEKIDQMIADKFTLSESVLSDDSTWLKDLNTKTFMDLVKLRNEALSDE